MLILKAVLMVSGVVAQPVPVAAPPPVPTTQPPLAVLPVRCALEDLRIKDAVPAFAPALTARLAETGAYKVLGADDVADMLRNEGERQAVGCSDDGCLAEIAGALGARLVVTGEVARNGNTLLWTATLMDQQEGTVVRRVGIQGQTIQGLLSQSEEVALALVGKDAEARLEGEEAMKRLGFSNKADMEDFRKFKKEHTTMTTEESLTRFIIDRNSESKMLTALEVLAFAAAAGVVPVLGLGHALNTTLSVYLHQYIAAMLLTVPVLIVPPISLVIALGGIGLTVWDALDSGSVKVHKEGCCRDDSTIADAETSSEFQRGAALAILFSGATSVATTFAAYGASGAAALVILLSGNGYSSRDPPAFDAPGYLQNALLTGLINVGCLCSAAQVCLGNGIMGLVLLMWPMKSMVDNTLHPLNKNKASSNLKPAPVGNEDGEEETVEVQP